VTHPELIKRVGNILVGRIKRCKITVGQFRLGIFLVAVKRIRNAQFGQDGQLMQRIFLFQADIVAPGFFIAAVLVFSRPA